MNMAVSLLTHRLIRTTDAKAKALRPYVDRLITTAKEGSLSSKRRVAEVIRTREMFSDFYEKIVPQFSDRKSGYTRVMKLGIRRGDAAPMSVVELLVAKPEPVEDPKAKKGKEAKPAGKGAASASAAASKKPKAKAAKG